MTNDFRKNQGAARAPPRLSPEEYAAKKKAEKEAIYQLLDNTASEVVQSPEKFKAYLDVQSRMDRYTANNALLMYKQFPQASQIKEFGDWTADGVKVNKGSKTFIILDPYEYTKKDGTIGIDFNLKRVLDVSQTNGKRPAAPTANRDPRKLVAVMLDSAPINIESTNELPYPDMGAFYKNEDQTLYVKRDIGDSVALCQCVAQELGHAELSMNSEVYSRRDMGFQAVCIGYMLCKKYGVDTQNFAIDRIPDELKNKEPKEIKAELGDSKYTVQRSKGLGENEADMMSLTTMNPATRRLIKVTPSDAIATSDMFDLLLGDNLDGRKTYIADYGHLYLDAADVS